MVILSGPRVSPKSVMPFLLLDCYQPYGEEGLLIADVDTEQATALLAKRYKPTD